MSSAEPAPSAAATVVTTPTPNTPEGTAAPVAPVAPPAWYGELSSDDKTYIANKGWDKEGKSFGDVLKSYKNIERLRGVDAEKLVRLPDPTKPEEVSEFRAKLGVPETPAGYDVPELQVGDGLLDGEALAAIAHRIQLDPYQFATFTSETAQFFQQSIQQQTEAVAERDSAEKMTLEKEWAGLKEENYAAATKAATKFGLDETTLNGMQQGLGYRKTLELLTKIGRSFGEAKPPDVTRDEGDGFGITPAVAKTRLGELRGDADFRNKLLNGDVAAKQKWESLKKIAFTG